MNLKLVCIDALISVSDMEKHSFILIIFTFLLLSLNKSVKVIWIKAKNIKNFNLVPSSKKCAKLMSPQLFLFLKMGPKKIHSKIEQPSNKTFAPVNDFQQNFPL